MSAIVCGKRTFFEELLPSSPPVSSKRIRCSSSSTSPIRLSPPRPISSSSSLPRSPSSIDRIKAQLDNLIAIFPDMDKQLLERALEECGNDLDSAIKSLNALRLGSADRSDLSMEVNGQLQSQGTVTSDGDVASLEDPLAPNNLPRDGSEWVELFVGEMMSSTNMDDARVRASRVLEVLEKSIFARAGDATESLHKENMILKEQVEILMRENSILKRAVAIQHERQKDVDDRSQELQHLKQLVSQYQEQLRTLEMNNYALTMHLRQSQQSSSIPGSFHPDVF